MLYGLVGHIKIWAQQIIRCIIMSLMTSHENHQQSVHTAYL